MHLAWRDNRTLPEVLCPAARRASRQTRSHAPHACAAPRSRTPCAVCTGIRTRKAILSFHPGCAAAAGRLAAKHRMRRASVFRETVFPERPLATAVPVGKHAHYQCLGWAVAGRVPYAAGSIHQRLGHCAPLPQGRAPGACPGNGTNRKGQRLRADAGGHYFTRCGHYSSTPAPFTGHSPLFPPRKQRVLSAGMHAATASTGTGPEPVTTQGDCCHAQVTRTSLRPG